MKKLCTLFAFVILLSQAAQAIETYKVCWSRYTGWEPWGYAEYSGILAKHAKKHGIAIKLTYIDSYDASLSLYTSGVYQACTMTNMDALTAPASGGVDSTAVIVGDFSNGNDTITSKSVKKVTDLKGKNVILVEQSVSHYLLSRALSINGMTEKDLGKVINSSDAVIESNYITSKNVDSVVTWNPMAMNIAKQPKVTVVFDSSKIPGEIIDLMVVRTDSPDSLKKALAGAWFETMKVLATGDKKVISFLAKQAGGSLTDFQDQLKTTAIFYTADKATKFSKSKSVKNTMKYVRDFSFNKGILGGNNIDAIGIQFPDGTVLGDKSNVKLRFDSSYMEWASTQKL